MAGQQTVTAIDPYANKDVPWLLRSHAETRGDAVFLAWEPFAGPPREWTFAQFHGEVRAIAAGLLARGLKQGDRLLIHASNSPEFLLAWYACAMLGVVAVTTNPRCAAAEVAYFIQHSGARAAVVESSYLDLIDETGAALDWLVAIPADEPDAALPAGTDHFDSLRGDPATLVTPQLGPMTPLSVQYTSGTTSRPKGVVWTHANALWAGQIGAAHNQLRSEDVALVFTPLCHANAMSWGHLPMLWIGGKVVLQPRFSASRFWPVSLKHQCTWGNVIPFAIQAIADQPVPRHSFRHWVVGAHGLGGLDRHFGLGVLGAWGMTETVTHGTFTPPHLPAPDRSIGLPAPEYEIKVVDEQGAPVAIGETGLLKIRGLRGRALFLEYLNDSAATAASFDADGWFDTGDRVCQVEQGQLRFADRAKDMLKIGAENVAASEIEAVIATVPGVIEPAVVGRPHPMLDEEPVAFVRAAAPSPDLAEAILAACRSQLAGFKVPAEVRFMEEFPRSELNKVSKKDLRELAKADRSRAD